MATRDEAYAQYKAAYGSHWDADAEGDFENYWKNAKDSGLMQGAGYDRSWDQIMGDVTNRVSERFNRPTASNGGIGGDLDPYGLGQPKSVAQSWTGGIQQQPLQAPQQSERNNELWKMLMDRAMTSKNIDSSDPIIRPQVDAYRAEQERARRNDIADLAEGSGPLANLRGEARIAAERTGQNVAGFQSELMGRELTARRAEIQQALTGMQGVLSGDQQLALQRELALLDNAIKQQQIGLQGRGLDLDWQRALLQNDQFWADLGLRAEDRASYWDAVRSGQLN
jgi:hypothetical protein